MTESNDTPELQIDADWKAQAQAEKERLAQQEQEAAAKGDGDAPGGRGALPAADFKGLVGTLASQAVMGLGAMPDPQGRGVMIDLEGAKFAIDLLAVVEEKTKGNLTEDEDQELAAVLVELRARFVQITKMLAEQMTAGGTPEAATPEGGASKIVMPD